jgi:hypothetical protein
MSDALRTTEILDALIAKSSSLIWATEPQLGPKLRRIDFWTLHPQEGKGHVATSYEIKVSRSDFKRDSAMKQREARLYSDRFYYVAPKDMIKPDEIPDWAGLMEWNGDRFTFKVHAPNLSKSTPSWDFISSLLRTCGQVRRDLNTVLEAERIERYHLKRENEKLKRQLAQQNT